jgi:hypothetical protein
MKFRVQAALRVRCLESLRRKLEQGGSTTARIFHPNGRVDHFQDQALAYALWLGLPKGVRAAFRGANDSTPVYPWDYVDAL